MVETNNKHLYMMVAIVAIVAVVGIVTLTLQSSKTRNISPQPGLGTDPTMGGQAMQQRMCDNMYISSTHTCLCEDTQRGYETSFTSSSASACTSSCMRYYNCNSYANLDYSVTY
jgi:hypothetical protein